MKKIMQEAFTPSGLFGLLLSVLLGWFFLNLTFETGFLRGISSYWLSEVDDITQYIAGFNMYFTAPWSFPILAFDDLNYPKGTRATFVDIIPIYAFLLKLFVPDSFYPFNPYGYWIALCFVL